MLHLRICAEKSEIGSYSIDNEASLQTFNIKLTPKGSLMHICNHSIHDMQYTKLATDWLKTVWILNFP